MSRLRNPLAGEVAIVGFGTTDYVRQGGRKSRSRLAVEAAIAALRAAGIDRDEVDGLCGSQFQASPQNVQEGLGIAELSWWSSPTLPFSLLLTEAVHAVHSGACTTAIAYQSQLRTVATSSTAGFADPVRAVPDPAKQIDHHSHNQYLIPYGRRNTTYPGYMRRYMHEFRVGREAFGRVAINDRSNAVTNPHAALREPITMDDYLGARMVRDPMCVLDMDYIVDGADAVVVTTSERARDLADHPVYIDAIAYGSREHPEVDMYRGLDAIGQTVAADRLWGKTDLTTADVDLLLLYDGFTIITLKWLESLGFCKPGEAGDLLAAAWDPGSGRALLEGRVPINTHGGSLSEGATQGAGHLREAYVQLSRRAGARQVPGVRTAAVAIGGLFMNSTALVLRAE